MDRRPLFAVGLAAFLLIGAQQAVYGPAFAALQARFGVGVGEVGTIVSAHFAGGLVGVLAAGPLLPRLGYRWLVTAAALTSAGGLAAVASVPTWWAALASAAGAGVGFGLLVVLLNLAFARAYGVQATAPLNVLNATFGIGAVLAPVPVGFLLGRGLGAGALAPSLFGLAALGVLVAAAAAVTRAWPALPPPRDLAAAPVRWGLVVAFATLMGVYVALEANTAAWAPTHLALRLEVGQAALATSLFWGAVTAGRFAVAALAASVAPGALVVGGALLGAAAMGVAHVPASGLAAYALAGLALAPVFPAIIAWLTRSFPASVERVAPPVLAFANLGPVAAAPLVGGVVAWAGPQAVPTVLLAFAVVVAALAWSIRRAGAP